MPNLHNSIKSSYRWVDGFPFVTWVPPSSCMVYYDSLANSYQVLDSGWHWLGYRGYFKSAMETTLQDKKTTIINLRTYHDAITNYPILTESKLPITVDCNAHIKILNPLLAVTSVKDIDYMVDSICKSHLRNIFSTLDLDKIVTTHTALQVSLLASINTELRTYGISCVGFNLTRVQLPPNIHEAVAKLNNEQMQQRCALIAAQTKRKVLQINLELDRKKHEALLQKLEAYKKIDPHFSINSYHSSQVRSRAYSKCSSISLNQRNYVSTSPHHPSLERRDQ